MIIFWGFRSRKTHTNPGSFDHYGIKEFVGNRNLDYTVDLTKILETFDTKNDRKPN